MSEQLQNLDAPFEVLVNGKNIAPLILERLRQKRAADVLTATKRLALAAKEGAEGVFFRRVKNGGYVDFRMDPVLYHAFGQKWGYEAMRDRGFIDDCVKKGSAIRVKNRNVNATVGYTGSAGVPPAGSRVSRESSGVLRETHNAATGTVAIPSTSTSLGSAAVTHGRFHKTFSAQPQLATQN